MNTTLISGLVIAVAGPLLVSSVGLTDSCSSEVTSKIAEFIPTAIGAVVAIIGHKKTTDSVGALRSQLNNLGHIPRA